MRRAVGKGKRMTQIIECGEAHYEIRSFLGGLREKSSVSCISATNPWLYDDRECAERHLRDMGAYPKGSPAHYNDITVTGEE